MTRTALHATVLLSVIFSLCHVSVFETKAAGRQPADLAQPAGETDLALTDIFLDRRHNGNLWVRVTNHGPHPVFGAHAELIVVVDGGGLVTGCQLHVAPGQTMTINTGIVVDASQRSRDVTVTVRVPGMRDLRPSNNTYRELVP